MLTPQKVAAARKTGELAAARELVRLRFNLTQSIDVFQVIENANLWLYFTPLSGPLGAYLGNGILINNNRPRSVQRLTGAHEYGHYVLKHTNSVDSSFEISTALFRPNPTRRNDTPIYFTEEEFLNEVAAQAFAMDFLMPVTLINNIWQDLDFPSDGNALQHHHAYHLSLLLGASYKATLYQLMFMSKITPKRRQELDVEPKRIKQFLSGGIGLENSRADIWIINSSFTGGLLTANVDDELHVRLPEAPSTGYVWKPENPTPSSSGDQVMANIENVGFNLFSNLFEPSNAQSPQMIGAGGIRHFSLRALHPGYHQLRFTKGRPWQKNKPSEIFEIDVLVTNTTNGLSPSQQLALDVDI